MNPGSVPGSVATLAAALADRYAIERELGKGGMATVYLAEDLKHHRRVAVKVLRPELAVSLGAARFVREIEIAARLSHPHILPLFDSGEADGHLYYVMPYVPGESLRERLEREGRLSVEQAIRLTEQVASALTYAHERGVVHRDIKPENILLAGDQAIVADFGIARALEVAGGERLTGTGLALGSPAYMSPEQALGTGEVDARSDVYALGCVVYETIAGRTPFEGTAPHVIALHIAGTAPGLRATDPGIPLYVERAVDRALAKDPAARFQTPQEFAAALTTGTVVARVRRQRWRARSILGGGVLAGGVAVGLAAWWVGTLGQRMERLAVLPLANLSGDSTQQYLVSGVHEALIAELGRLGLSVTARRSIVRYRDTDKSIGEIARELGVDGVIEGSLYHDGDSLELVVRLYDGRERELWTASYEGVLSNVITLYRGFARAVARQVRLKLRPGEESRLAVTPEVNPAVYEAYLRGMDFLNRLTPETDDSAIASFNRAVALDPTDARAWAGMAAGYASLGHDASPLPDVWPRARAAAERAIRLDPELAEGWAALADCKSYAERDWAGAEQAFRRANELNPGLAMNHYHYAWFLFVFGRVEEAVAEHRRAQELDPLTPLHTIWLAGLYWEPGQFEHGLEIARENVRRYPNSGLAHHVLAGSAAPLGLYDEAIAAHRRAAELSAAWLPFLGKSYALAGRTEEALRIARQVEAEPPSGWNALGLASIYAALGNTDEMLRWLAYKPRHAWAAGFVSGRAFPEVIPHLGDPRLQAVMREMNLRRAPGDRYPTPLPVTPPPLSGGVTVQ